MDIYEIGLFRLDIFVLDIYVLDIITCHRFGHANFRLLIIKTLIGLVRDSSRLECN